MNNPLVTVQVCYLRIMQIFLSSFLNSACLYSLQHLSALITAHKDMHNHKTKGSAFLLFTFNFKVLYLVF